MRLLAIALLLALLWACAPLMEEGAPEAGDGQRLADSVWQVAAIDGRPSLPGVSSTMAIRSDLIGGSTGCNRYSARLERSGSALSIGPVAATKMACAPPAMEQEAKLIAALQRVRSYRLEDGELVLLDVQGGERVRLVRTAGKRLE